MEKPFISTVICGHHLSGTLGKGPWMTISDHHRYIWEQVIHQQKNIKYQDLKLGIVLKVKRQQLKMNSEKGQVTEYGLIFLLNKILY